MASLSNCQELDVAGTVWGKMSMWSRRWVGLPATGQ